MGLLSRLRTGRGAGARGSPLWASSVASELVEEFALEGSPLWASSVASELVEEQALEVFPLLASSDASELVEEHALEVSLVRLVILQS